MYISYLRQKLDQNNLIDPIETVRGVGYRLEANCLGVCAAAHGRLSAGGGGGDCPDRGRVLYPVRPLFSGYDRPLAPAEDGHGTAPALGSSCRRNCWKQSANGANCTITPTPMVFNPEQNSGDSEDHPGETSEYIYDTEAAAIFVLPLNEEGQLLFDPNAVRAPFFAGCGRGTGRAGRRAAIGGSSGWRTVHGCGCLLTNCRRQWHRLCCSLGCRLPIRTGCSDSF